MLGNFAAVTTVSGVFFFFLTNGWASIYKGSIHCSPIPAEKATNFDRLQGFWFRWHSDGTLANKEFVVLCPLLRASSAGDVCAVLCCVVFFFLSGPQDYSRRERECRGGVEKLAGGKALEALPLCLSMTSRVGCGTIDAVWCHAVPIPSSFASETWVQLSKGRMGHVSHVICPENMLVIVELFFGARQGLFWP